MLAFTTVALGGFRGLISNFLWIRANDLQQDDKFFEAAQLANWITDLEPHFSQVWAFQGWNMAYNISVKFKDFPDRWRWVEQRHRAAARRGPALQSGRRFDLPANWPGFSSTRWAQNLDDANMYYKQQWAKEMTPFFGANGTNFENLIHPQTADDNGPTRWCSAKNTRLTRCSRKKWTSNTARSTGGCPRRTRFTGARADWTRRRKIPTR